MVHMDKNKNGIEFVIPFLLFNSLLRNDFKDLGVL